MSMLIALLEDDPHQALSMIEALASPGRELIHCATAGEFFRRIAHETVAAFIVDWRLPDMDGTQVVQRLRQIYGRTAPLIVVTSDHDESVALTALALDADDFVYKPVSRPILRARVDAVLRRYRKDPLEGDLISMPPYLLDRHSHQLSINGQWVALKAREFDLAWMLFSNPERFMSKGELLASVWGSVTEAHSHSLAQHVSVLRRKLGLAAHGFRLANIYGAGYRFHPPPASGQCA